MTNATKTTAALTQTYVSRVQTRACEEFGGSDLTYTDTIDYAARTVRWSVVGRSDGERVNESGVRPCDPSWVADPVVVEAGRRRSGWVLTSKAP